MASRDPSSVTMQGAPAPAPADASADASAVQHDRSAVRRALSGFGCGLLFGLGLILAGMSDPAKVLSFLDLLGDWDPSLALVMVAAAATTMVGFRLSWRRAQPLLAGAFTRPTRRNIDVRLVGGAALFGVGWGISGYCPGPAWTALPLGAPGTLVFVPSMLAGMWLARYIAPDP